MEVVSVIFLIFPLFSFKYQAISMYIRNYKKEKQKQMQISVLGNTIDLYELTFNPHIEKDHINVFCFNKYIFSRTLVWSISIYGAWEVDEQRIISGLKQCSRHLNKKMSLPIGFFLDQTK